MLLVRDVMTRDVATVGPDAKIDAVIHIMVSHHVSGIPVLTETGQIAGIVTEGDLLQRVETATDRGKHRKRLNFIEFLLGGGKEMTQYIRSHSRRVSDLMTENVVTIADDRPLAEVVRLMEENRVRRLPVLQEGRMVGIVSRADLVAALGRKLAETAPQEGLSDVEVEARIRAALESATWFGGGNSVDVRVEDGVATMDGVIYDERLRNAIRVAVETVPGVAEVKDHITFVEPMTGTLYPP
jgi:CBS domain-containing protein